MRERDCAWVFHGGGFHPAVVVRVLPDGTRVMLVCGTSTAGRALKHEKLGPKDPDGVKLGLQHDTYFYEGPGAFVRIGAGADEIRPTGHVCSIELFLRLRALVGLR